MKHIRNTAIIVALLAIGIAQTGCDEGGPGAGMPDLETFGDSVSWAIGMNMGASLAQLDRDSIEYDLDILLQSIRSRVAGDSTSMPDTVIQRVLMALQQNLQQRQEQMRESESTSNMEEGTEYYEKFLEEEGVQKTESGLAYRVIEAGSGASPDSNDVVHVKYTGRHVDGEVFDESPEGETRQFSPNQVIPGWSEAIKLMKPGARYEVVIPPQIGYGPMGAGPIGPNETLIFEIELDSVEQVD